MTFTVVRSVREAGATVPEPSERLQRSTGQAMPLLPGAMELPYAEQVIRLDFHNGDFACTVPGGLP